MGQSLYSLHLQAQFGCAAYAKTFDSCWFAPVIERPVRAIVISMRQQSETGPSMHALKHNAHGFRHNFVFIDPNVWYNEDECRKQARTDLLGRMYAMVQINRVICDGSLAIAFSAARVRQLHIEVVGIARVSLQCTGNRRNRSHRPDREHRGLLVHHRTGNARTRSQATRGQSAAAVHMRADVTET